MGYKLKWLTGILLFLFKSNYVLASCGGECPDYCIGERLRKRATEALNGRVMFRGPLEESYNVASTVTGNCPNSDMTFTAKCSDDFDRYAVFPVDWKFPDDACVPVIPPVVPEDLCAQITCQHNGQCEGGRCVNCDAGYNGKMCEQKIADLCTSPPKSDSIDNGNIAIVTSGTSGFVNSNYKLKCFDGYKVSNVAASTSTCKEAGEYPSIAAECKQKPVTTGTIILIVVVVAIILVVVAALGFFIWTKYFASPAGADQNPKADDRENAGQQGIKNFTDCSLPEGMRPDSECISIEMDSIGQDEHKAQSDSDSDSVGV
eukprot:933586_1